MRSASSEAEEQVRLELLERNEAIGLQPLIADRHLEIWMKPSSGHACVGTRRPAPRPIALVVNDGLVSMLSEAGVRPEATNPPVVRVVSRRHDDDLGV